MSAVPDLAAARSTGELHQSACVNIVSAISAMSPVVQVCDSLGGPTNGTRARSLLDERDGAARLGDCHWTSLSDPMPWPRASSATSSVVRRSRRRFAATGLPSWTTTIGSPSITVRTRGERKLA
jgi:hypothetical protein